MNDTSMNVGFEGTPEYQTLTTRQAVVDPVFEIWKLSFIKTGEGHVPYIPTNMFNMY